MNNKLILIGGLPGSGKTYIGKIIAKELNASYIDKDTVSRDFTETFLISLNCSPHDRESEVYLAKIRKLEYSTMMKLAMENIELGQDVICSAPFVSEFKSIDWIEERKFDIEMADAELFLIWIHVDESCANDRIISRGARRDDWKLSNWSKYIESVPHIKPEFDFVHYLIDNSLKPSVPLDKQIINIMKELKYA